MTIAQALLHVEFYRYLITCTDYFSKRPEAQALPSKCAAGVANFLLSLITRFGCFQICISDQGREFVNEINNNLFALAGVKHCVSSVYHPQTNGLDERMNQTITKVIMKYVNSEIEDWDEHIDAVLFSYRTSIHASTKYTPFFFMYGRDAILPLQLTKNPSEKFSSEPQLQVQGLEGCNTEQTNKEGLQNRTDEIKRISQILIPQAIKFINVAQTRQKCNYDKRCTPAKYCLVLKKNMKNVARAGGKQEKSG